MTGRAHVAASYTVSCGTSGQQWHTFLSCAPSSSGFPALLCSDGSSAVPAFVSQDTSTVTTALSCTDAESSFNTCGTTQPHISTTSLPFALPRLATTRSPRAHRQASPVRRDVSLERLVVRRTIYNPLLQAGGDSGHLRPTASSNTFGWRVSSSPGSWRRRQSWPDSHFLREPWNSQDADWPPGVEACQRHSHAAEGTNTGPGNVWCLASVRIPVCGSPSERTFRPPSLSV